MCHMSSNFVIKFESESVAHARSTLHAVCGSDERDLGVGFHEGGYYYWSFRRESSQRQGGAEGGDGEWKISYLFLDVNWTLGDSLGLNEEGAANGK